MFYMLALKFYILKNDYFSIKLRSHTRLDMFGHGKLTSTITHRESAVDPVVRHCACGIIFVNIPGRLMTLSVSLTDRGRVKKRSADKHGALIRSILQLPFQSLRK